MASRKYKVLALSIGNALSKLVGIAVTMVMARVLFKEDVAAYKQTMLAYISVAPIISLGIGQGMYYFLPVEKIRVRGRVLDGITVVGLMGLLFAIFIACGGNEILAKRFSNPKVANMLMWMIPYAIITTPSKLTSSILVARDRVTLSAVFGVCRQLLIGVATVIPLLIWRTPESGLIGNVVASILMAFAAFTLIYRNTPADSSVPTLSGMTQLTKLTVPLALGGMFGMISMQLDKLVVSFMCAPDDFAVYALGAIEVPLIAMVTGAITAVALTDMRKSVDSGDPGEALRLFHVIAEKSSLIVLPVMLFLLLTSNTFIRYLYGDGYEDSAIPFRIYLLLLPIRTVVFGSLIVALGKTRFIMYRSMVGLAINCSLCVFLVSTFGPWGAGIGTVATIYCWVVPANLFVLSRELATKWWRVLPLAELAKVVVALAPLAMLSLIILAWVQNPDVEFAVLVVLFAAYLLVYWNGKLYTPEQVLSRLRIRSAPGSS